MVTIENWSITSDQNQSIPPEMRNRFLHGEVYGHSSKKDGTHISSSAIILLELSKRTCVTVHSVYRLGKPHPDYEKTYPESRMV